jgi:glycosyltransferase involved in cell wall biosynthesis
VRWRLRLAHRLLADASVVCVSPAVARTIAGITSPHLLDVIPNPVAVAHLSGSEHTPRWGGERLRLLGIGALSRVKSFDTAVAALAELPEATLTLLGDGPERAALERLAERLAVRDRLALPGRVADVGDRLRASDVLLHPSHAETFGYALLDASLHHVPVVVRDAPGLIDIVPRHAPGLVAEPTGAGFAEAARKAAATPPDEWRFDDARALIESTMSPDGVASAWLELLSDLP